MYNLFSTYWTIERNKILHVFSFKKILSRPSVIAKKKKSSQIISPHPPMGKTPRILNPQFSIILQVSGYNEIWCKYIIFSSFLRHICKNIYKNNLWLELKNVVEFVCVNCTVETIHEVWILSQVFPS